MIKKGIMMTAALCMSAGILFMGTPSFSASAEETIVIENETTAVTQPETVPESETAAAAQPESAPESETAAAAQSESAPESETAAETESETEADPGMKGQMIFAVCEDFVNIRKGPGVDSDVIGKMYNHCMATVLSEDGSWFEIQSGNAVGFVKNEYFATGAEAEAIAAETAYNVAKVYAYELNVRALPDDTSEVISVAYEGEELEAVAIEGDWIKVALGDDVYGYVHNAYVEYKTYYPEGETLEEEQARLEAEAAAEEEQYEEEQYEEEQYYEENSDEGQNNITVAPAEGSQTQTQPQTEAQTQPQTEAETQPQTEAETQPQTEAETQPQTEAETQPQTEAQTQPQTEAETQPQTEAETQAPAEEQTEGSIGDDSGDMYYDADTGEMKPFDEA